MKKTIMGVLVLLMAVPVWAGDVVLNVAPRIGRSPQDIHVIAKIEPGVDNRFACLTIDGPQSSSSCWELHTGDHRTWELWRKGFPGGRYVVGLDVVDRFGGTIHKEAQVCIIGSVREDDVDCAGSGEGENP